MGSDMSRPKLKNKKNSQNGFKWVNRTFMDKSFNVKFNFYFLFQSQTIRNNQKHLVCKEIDLVAQPNGQQQQVQENQPIYANSHPFRTSRQLTPQPIPQPTQYLNQRDYSRAQEQYVAPPRVETYRDIEPGREIYRELENSNTVNTLFENPIRVPSFQMSPRVTRYYNDGVSAVDRPPSCRPERYRTHKPCLRRDEEEFIERYEPCEEPVRPTYTSKPTQYRYYDDLDKINTGRYRSKSSDKYIDAKEYGTFDDPNIRKYENYDCRKRLQSRSVYFLKNDSRDNYESSSDTRYNNMQQPKKVKPIDNNNSNTHSESFTFKPITDSVNKKLAATNSTNINNRHSHHQQQANGNTGAMPIVNVVSTSNDIVYVPMVKHEFIKRESQKIESIGQYHQQGTSNNNNKL